MVQQQPQQQQVGVRFGKSKNSHNPHLLPSCGTILPKQPTFKEIQQSPPVFRMLWGGQHTPSLV
jgi:hypothetical protein